jgi:DNA repair ATPase RecN
MSIIEELQTKLSETRDNVEKVLVDLSHYSQVKDSLQAANVGLEGASGKLDVLTDSLHSSTKSLNRATASLEEVIEIIRSTDPAEVLKGQQQIEESLETMSDRLSELPDTTHVHLKLDELESKYVYRMKVLLRVQFDEKIDHLRKSLEGISEDTRQSVTSSNSKTKKLVESMSGKMQFAVVAAIANAALAIWIIKLLLE